MLVRRLFMPALEPVCVDRTTSEPMVEYLRETFFHGDQPFYNPGYGWDRLVWDGSLFRLTHVSKEIDVMAIGSMSLVCLNSSMSASRPWAFINSWAINVRLDINLFPVGSMKSMGFVIPNDLSLDDALRWW